MMRSGKLRNKVDIEQRSATQDSFGQPVETWALVAAVWADILHVSGIETIKADADISVVRVSIRIRYRTGINAGMRVNHGGVLYDIKAVLPDARKAYIDLPCERVV